MIDRNSHFIFKFSNFQIKKNPYFRGFKITTMHNPKAIELADKILAKSAKEFDAEWVSKNLKALREMAREEGDPAVIKILRLAYEHIDENGDFNIGFSADEDEEGEEEEGLITDLEYLLTLVQRSEREKSKEEIKEMKKLLLSLK